MFPINPSLLDLFYKIINCFRFSKKKEEHKTLQDGQGTTNIYNGSVTLIQNTYNFNSEITSNVENKNTNTRNKNTN